MKIIIGFSFKITFYGFQLKLFNTLTVATIFRNFHYLVVGSQRLKLML